MGGAATGNNHIDKVTIPMSTTPSRPKYRRLLLKLSGEALMGSRAYGIDVAVV